MRAIIALLGISLLLPALAGCMDDIGTGRTGAASSERSSGSATRLEEMRDAPKEKRIYLAPPPSFLDRASADAVAQAVQRGIQTWDGWDGWRVQVVAAERNANAYGEYVKEWGGDRLGVAFSTQIMQIGLGDSACNGKWARFTLATIQHIAAHEMGHILGRVHSNDPKSIMYPKTTTEYAQPCEIDADTRSVAAGSTLYWTLKPQRASTYSFEFSEGAGGSFDVCFTQEGRRQGCTAEYRRFSDSWDVNAGTHRLEVRCQNWVDPCSIAYRLAVAPYRG